MTPSQRTISLYQVGTARNEHATIEAMLGRVIEGYAPSPEGTASSPVAGIPDIHYRTLRLARSKLDLLSDDGLVGAAGPGAKKRYRESFVDGDKSEAFRAAACSATQR